MEPGRSRQLAHILAPKSTKAPSFNRAMSSKRQALRRINQRDAQIRGSCHERAPLSQTVARLSGLQRFCCCLLMLLSEVAAQGRWIRQEVVTTFQNVLLLPFLQASTYQSSHAAASQPQRCRNPWSADRSPLAQTEAGNCSTVGCANFSP